MHVAARANAQATRVIPANALTLVISLAARLLRRNTRLWQLQRKIDELVE